MAKEIEEEFSPLDPEADVKPDAGSQRESVGGDEVEVSEGDEPFAGGAGEGDDLPTSGLR